MAIFGRHSRPQLLPPLRTILCECARILAHRVTCRCNSLCCLLLLSYYAAGPSPETLYAILRKRTDPVSRGTLVDVPKYLWAAVVRKDSTAAVAWKCENRVSAAERWPACEPAGLAISHPQHCARIARS